MLDSLTHQPTVTIKMEPGIGVSVCNSNCPQGTDISRAASDFHQTLATSSAAVQAIRAHLLLGDYSKPLANSLDIQQLLQLCSRLVVKRVDAMSVL